MIKFFRRIRQQLLAQNRFNKYMIYAIGEIVLVVIGILIALSINNWNEKRKENDKLNVYRGNLIIELQSDLKRLDWIKSQTEMYKQSLQKYIDYYNLKNPDMDTLVQILNKLDYDYSKFTSEAYSIEEIISTGYLSLFLEDEKKALLSLKSKHIEISEYYNSNVNDLLNYTKSVNDQIDVLFLYGYTSKEHPEVANWKYNIASPQLRLYNNELASVLYFYDVQESNHEIVRDATQTLLNLLKDTYNSRK